MGIVDDERAAQAVAVLRRYVAVVPERARLIGRREVVQERIADGDRALVHKRTAVRPVCPRLEEAMPMLWIGE